MNCEIIGTSLVYILAGGIQNSSFERVTVNATFAYQGGFIGINQHVGGNTSIINSYFSGWYASNYSNVSILFNLITNSVSSGGVLLQNCTINTTYEVWSSYASLFATYVYGATLNVTN